MTTSVPNGARATSFTTTPLARAAQCDDEMLRVFLVDGREIAAPLAWFPRLFQATPHQRAGWQLIGNGEGLHWEALDEDISVASLLGLPGD